MDDEDLPFVALSELNCLRLEWPKTIFMSRYQCNLNEYEKTTKNALDVRNREIVLIVENIFSRI